AAGKMVAKRFLRLYDCRSWQQTYIKQAKESGNALQRIEETSTSILVGTTFNNCRFNGLETRDGMRRRVNYYVSEKLSDVIYWPADFDGGEFARVCELFLPLTTVSGEFARLGGGAWNLWKKLQRENRELLHSSSGVDSASEAHSAALAEEGAKTLKFAMIFELCRWAKNSFRDWQTIQADTLRLAADHARACLTASRQLDQVARRAEVAE